MIFHYPKAADRLAGIRLLAMDIDGVLTDGRIIYSSHGDETRAFHATDGLGIVLLHQLGIEVAWISGRKSAAVDRRAEELNVRHLLQCVSDKGLALTQLAIKLVVDTEQIAFIGDDWNDLPAFEYAGLAIAVANADPHVISKADAVTEINGGSGAVREVINAIIDSKGKLDAALEDYVKGLRQPGRKTGVGQ